MKFFETPLKDAKLIELEPRSDDRGYFTRVFCAREMQASGVETLVVQSNVSYNKFKGTLRGMHFQKNDAVETKIVRCLQGSLYDVIIDLRPESPTYKQHYGVELSLKNNRMLYVPRGFAHGFITLEDDTTATYMVSNFYAPEWESGVRYNDPAFGINWPTEIKIITDKDATWPLLDV